MTTESQQILKLCPGCPWRRSNHGTSSPVGFYRKSNLKRLWNQIRKGQGPQSCHMTDPNHPDHVKSGTPLGAKPHECPGSIALVYRELNLLQEIVGNDGDINENAVRDYKKQSPKGLTNEGLMHWFVFRIQLAHIPGHGPPIPEIEDWLVKDTALVGRL